MTTRPLQTVFVQRPGALGIMLNAFRPRPGLTLSTGVPAIGVVWRQARLESRELSAVGVLTGMADQAPQSILTPHILTFRMNMAVLTHPAFPLPLWGALQIRNHLLLHQSLDPHAPYDVQARVATHRLLAKGVEVDIHTRLQQAGELGWESCNTFYYRHRVGDADAMPSPRAVAPAVTGCERQHWRAPTGSGWRFGALTGDYNGIHWSSAYAKAFGFRGAFFHPQRVVGQCLTHLGEWPVAARQRLDVWLRGPVYYGADLRLRSGTDRDGLTFGLYQGGDERPAIVGQWRHGLAGQDLRWDEHVAPKEP